MEILTAIAALNALTAWKADKWKGGEFLYLMSALCTAGFGFYWMDAYPDPEWFALIMTVAIEMVAVWWIIRILVRIVDWLGI